MGGAFMNIEKTMENLRNNGIVPFFVKTKEEAKEKVKELIPKGAKVGVGGSVTLAECGIIDLLRSSDYDFLDRYKEGLSREEVNNIFRECFFADVYLMSTNALTEDGELYNVDGNSNRVAALLYGPESVIVVTGKNKIVRNLSEAVLRMKTVAAPKNAKRLSCKTYCTAAGECMDRERTADAMTKGCASPDRICSNYTVTGRQRIKDRIKVIIIDEETGY